MLFNVQHAEILIHASENFFREMMQFGVKFRCTPPHLSISHHIRFGSEFLRLQALDGHPLDRQLSFPVVLDAVVLLIKHISSHAEVCHLHSVRLVQPAGAMTL